MNNTLSQLERLKFAVRTLDNPPQPPGWNAKEIADLLPTAQLSQPRLYAAVLVPIIRHCESLSLLFTRRTEQMRLHPGQVSFPGGRIESTDSNAVAAALRETHEETGIALASILPFGYLDCFDTVSGYCVSPVAGFVDANYVATPDSAEVADIFEVPLDYILDQNHWQQQTIEWQGRSRPFSELLWNGQRIWGATAGIMMNLMRRLEAVP